MDLDAPVCLCFGVSRRKLLQFVRVERPRLASQLSACGGAGTGCGWCIPHVRRLFADPAALDMLSEEDYAAGRARHRATPTPASEPMTDAAEDAVRRHRAEFGPNPEPGALFEAFGEVIASEPENVSLRVAARGLAAAGLVAEMGDTASEELRVEARLSASRVRDGAEVAALGSTPSADVAGCKDAAEAVLTRLESGE